MAALVSPGVSITVSDESQYLPTAVGTIPFVLFASSENKVVNGAVAPGTKKSNAGKVYGISSQRELVATFGTPEFRQNAAGTALHGNELNEYGLMAAYSALGLGNRVWAIRADINLDELVGTTVRPVGEVPDGTNWFDFGTTAWGIYQYNQISDSYTNIKPLIISSWDDITVQAQIPFPNQSLGVIGSYAAVVRDANNYVFYKNNMNNWVQVGGTDWQDSFATIVAAEATPNLTTAGDFTINGVTIQIPNATPDNATVANIINAALIDGVTADTENGFLAIYVNDLSASNGVDADGALEIGSVTAGLLDKLGIVAGQYYAPTLYYGPFNQTPAWSTFDAIPRPTGSIWLKTTVSGDGANFAIKQYNSSLKSWSKLATPVYATGYEAIYGLDATGGGAGIRAGATFVKYDTSNNGKLSFKFYTLSSGGATTVAASNAASAFTPGSTFTMLVSQPGTDMPNTYNITVGGMNASDFVTAVLAANIPNVTARANASGVITLVHSAGGLITLINTSVGSNPVTTAGFTTSTEGVVANIVPGSITLTNWRLARYTFSDTMPYTAPTDGRLWYYSDPTAVDIMICDINGWKGYKNVARDARGANLQDTDPAGVIVAASEPTLQSDNTDLVAGDLWLDTSDLENYPRLYRYTSTNKWQLIDNTDRVSQNGIVFADARWDGFSDDTGGTTDPITGDYPNCADMQMSNYIDLDAPDYRLFPRGTLLFNTRRSGYNVKKYVGNYFNAQAYPNDPLPDVKAAWVTDSGAMENGAPYTGHHAQRAIIVQALKAALDGSLDIREEGYNFNLLVCPGYSELIPNLIALNNDRSNTGFIIGDTPMTLAANINAITEYNNTKAINRDPYVALYYPHGLTNDLAGNEIAVPASHIMLRTFIRSDNVAYQWFAPAGTRRGLVDNASSIGYVDANSGLFIKSGINQSIRDAMYELNLNPITLLNSVGLVVYGQKTRNPVSSSLDRVNVARLVNYLRSVLQPLANQFLFEPNDKITRDQVKTVVESVLNDLIAKRGLYDYLVVCDTSNNTSDRIARNELYIDIAIEPMKAVEFIYIPIRLKNPGAIRGTAA
jgi:hypothetical protein